MTGDTICFDHYEAEELLRGLGVAWSEGQDGPLHDRLYADLEGFLYVDLRQSEFNFDHTAEELAIIDRISESFAATFGISRET